MSATHREIIANVDRLNELLDRHGYSAVVVRSGKNFTYLAGFSYPGTLGRHLDFPDSPREVLLVWPRQGEPAMILNSFAAPLARRDSWLDRIEVCDDYAESPYSRMADLLKQMGLEGERVGFEKTYLSAARWEEIRGLLPRMTMTDCTDLMDQVRWIKTPGEVTLLEEAANILDE
ncbi:MAG: aminopeptidase P family N-terminal domain-containing protein, partial [Dehalococcoidia bacterium]|nr:aminopeptidase P family N-terminal domain-containing protein [Dehalococcoidia bacterium]